MGILPALGYGAISLAVAAAIGVAIVIRLLYVWIKKSEGNRAP